MNDNKTHASIKNIQTKTNIKNIQPKPQNLNNVCLSRHWRPMGHNSFPPRDTWGKLMLVFVHFFLLSASGTELWQTHSHRDQGKQSQSFSSPSCQDSDNFRSLLPLTGSEVVVWSCKCLYPITRLLSHSERQVSSHLTK